MFRGTWNINLSFNSDCKTWHDFTMFIGIDYFRIEKDRTQIIKIKIIQ